MFTHRLSRCWNLPRDSRQKKKERDEKKVDARARSRNARRRRRQLLRCENKHKIVGICHPAITWLNCLIVRASTEKTPTFSSATAIRMNSQSDRWLAWESPVRWPLSTQMDTGMNIISKLWTEKKNHSQKAKGFLVHRECLCVCAREFVRERQKHNMREIVYPTTQKQMKSSISAKQNVTREHAHTHMHARAHEYQDALLVMCTQCFTLVRPRASVVMGLLHILEEEHSAIEAWMCSTCK